MKNTKEKCKLLKQINIPVVLRDARGAGGGEMLPKSISSLLSESLSFFLSSFSFFTFDLNGNVVCFSSN